MNAFETSTTVEPQGDIHVAGLPFPPGTEVDVVISPKRKTAAEFIQEWRRVCDELRGLPQTRALSDDDLRQEIRDYRAGR